MSYNIALIPGDGIGKEVVPEAVRVMDILSGQYGFAMKYAEFPFSCEYYLKTGSMMPADGIEQLKKFDAIEFPSMFEPVHGSAPDIAGKGIANPIGTLWSAQMMLAFLGEEKAAQSLMLAIEVATAGSRLTADLGGDATTQQFTDAVIEQIATRGSL